MPVVFYNKSHIQEHLILNLKPISCIKNNLIVKFKRVVEFGQSRTDCLRQTGMPVWENGLGETWVYSDVSTDSHDQKDEACSDFVFICPPITQSESKKENRNCFFYNRFPIYSHLDPFWQKISL